MEQWAEDLVGAGNDADARARVLGLIDFLAAYDARKNPPVHDVAAYKRFLVRDTTLPDVPTHQEGPSERRRQQHGERGLSRGSRRLRPFCEPALAERESAENLGPDECSFVLPNEARANDVAVYYVGGRFQKYVAIGRILTNGRRAGAGAWKGYDYVNSSRPRLLAEFQPGTVVAAQCGFPAPRDCAVVPSRVAPDPVRILRGKPIDPVDRAVEGAAT